ncbi:MAG TPA: ZIP family metal transporter [Vicinamibacteria bacterium]|nr:ZIP family metal transporter [Vicinamibacteria bacterium]
MSAISLAAAAFVSTALGGAFALRFSKSFRSILGLTAGVLLGVVGFEVLPELFTLTHATGVDPMRGMLALVGGFLLFHASEKLLLIHHAQESSYVSHHHPTVGTLSALALTGHSFMDGVGIGLGFQVSPRTGAMVALAVIAHDFADGLNTVTLMLTHGNDRKRALIALALDAVAPMAGAASTLLFHLPPTALVLYLGFFAGFLLYIGAADILPEAHSEKSSPSTIALTCAGAGFAYLVSRLAG